VCYHMPFGSLLLSDNKYLTVCIRKQQRRLMVNHNVSLWQIHWKDSLSSLNQKRRQAVPRLASTVFLLLGGALVFF